MPPSITSRALALLLVGAASCGGGGDEVPDLPVTPTLEPVVPSPTGPCPAIEPGIAVFRPAGMAEREVLLWASPKELSPPTGGALVLYWHGTGSLPLEASFGLGVAISDIIAQGGVVAAPAHDPAAGTYPWFLTTVGGGDGRDDDLRLADEIAACVSLQRGTDARRIHTAGMSAGALQSVQLAYRRSAYIASVASYSGGVIQQLGVPSAEEPKNPFAALIFYGGPGDFVVVSFEAASQTFYADQIAGQRFAVLCNHGSNHTIPFDATSFVWEFFQAHPFDRVPSPWAEALPADAPDYCVLDLSP